MLAATELQKAGQRVTVLDKGRGVGGRMATRRLLPDNSAVADHGAQFFTVRDAQFQQQVEDWISAEAAAEWCLGFGRQDGHPRYRGSQGMTSIPKLLAQELDVYTQSKVSKIQQEEELWRLETESGLIYRAKNLIVTSPVPQSLALLQSGNVDLPADAEQALNTIVYDPCFAVMCLLNQKSSIPVPGGIQVQGEVIDWIGDNQQKEISAKPSVTIHASADFTRQYIDEAQEKIGQMLIAVADEVGYFDANHVVATQVHRWLYAKPITLYPDRCLCLELNGLRLVFAGDAFKHARVEGAALSGLAAAAELLG